MTYFKVELRQKEKISLPLTNVREEINLMFNSTVGSASRDDLAFFIILYFLAFRKDGHSFLYTLLKEQMPILQKFVQKMADVEGYLNKGEYAQLKTKMQLDNVLEQDTLFLVMDLIPKLESLKVKFASVLEIDPFLKTEMGKIYNEFAEKIIEFKRTFSKKRISDFRYDENWDEVHDLSKSVYKTIGMRLIRKLDISLQKKAELEELTHRSPLVVEVLQRIDIQMIFDLWNSFHLSEYLIGYLKSEAHTLTFLASWVDPKSIFNSLLGDAVKLPLAYMYGTRKAKKIALETFHKNKKELEKTGKLNPLMHVLENSYLASPEKLKQRIEFLDKQIERLESKETLTEEESERKKSLKEEVKKLKNIEVKVLRLKADAKEAVELTEKNDED